MTAYVISEVQPRDAELFARYRVMAPQSMDHARRWYAFPAYGEALAVRRAGAPERRLVVEGVA